MAQRPGMTFAFITSPVGPPGAKDEEMYQEALVDCKVGQQLGYEAVWALEHHFSDYYPTPDVMLFLSHVAAVCPGLGLGTQVIVTPWHNPIRLTEQIAMLQIMSKGKLHLGLGRGTAKYEFDVFGLDMAEARVRFKEVLEIIRLGLSGERFSYEGKFYQVHNVRIRPRVADTMPNFYGAIGSRESATVMADLDLPPLCLLSFPDYMLQKILAEWEAATRERGGDVNRPKAASAKLYMADTDEEALALAREYMPEYFRLHAEHYETEADHWSNIPGYQQHSKAFANLRRMADPDNLDRYLDLQLVGSAATVTAKVARLQELGFDYITVGTSAPQVPREVRLDTLRRFAEEVMPRFTGPAGRQQES